jgi:hypothetical protein
MLEYWNVGILECWKTGGIALHRPFTPLQPQSPHSKTEATGGNTHESVSPLPAFLLRVLCVLCVEILLLTNSSMSTTFGE